MTVTQRLAGKVALITGAGSGFGAGIAKRYAVEGARVIVVDIDEAAARKVAAGLATPGGEALALQCDVGNGASVAAMVARAVEAAGGFDVIVNNAGLTQRPMRIAKIGEAELDRLLEVNVKSLYHMAVHALPVLRKRGGGVVINIASVSAMRPRPGMTWYNATKAAVIVITQSMAAELAPDRIRVNAIAPAVGRTALFDVMFADDRDAAEAKLAETIPLGRLCLPEDVAAAAVYLASDDANYVTGAILPVDGGRTVA
jgi:3-oxoacyl-[acyl-carrier protein] reductase